MTSRYKSLQDIAFSSLNSCYTSLGYVAGVHHFVDLWARDSLFACFSDVESKQTYTTLKTFEKFQRNDGLIPYRIRRSSLGLFKYLGKPKILRTPCADFRSMQSFRTVYDGGAIYLLVLSMRLLKNKDRKEYDEFSESIERLVKYYTKRFHCDLIEEGWLCEWADAVMKSGYVLYTNIIYLGALKKLLSVYELFGTDDSELKNLYNYIHARVYEKLWNGKYFADYHSMKRRDYFASHPNLLAIILEITTESESKSIVDYTEKYCLKELGVLSNYPKYPWYLIPIQNYLSGIPDYHNGIFWLQPWLHYVAVLLKIGRIDDAYMQLDKIQNIVKQQGIVYENYEKDFQPIKRFAYRAEGPFAWNSGLILWVLSML